MRGRGGRRGAPAAGGYQEWADFLERWAEGGAVDSSALGPLDQEAYAKDTWERLTKRFAGAMDKRLQRWQAALSRAVTAARDEFECGRALQQSRTGLRAIRALATDERVPEHLRTGLTGIVDGAVRSMQEQLEKNTVRMRGTGDANRWVEARLRTLRQNPLTAVSGDTAVERAAATAASTGSTASAAPATSGNAASDPLDTPRRRIVRP